MKIAFLSENHLGQRLPSNTFSSHCQLIFFAVCLISSNLSKIIQINFYFTKHGQVQWPKLNDKINFVGRPTVHIVLKFQPKASSIYFM